MELIWRDGGSWSLSTQSSFSSSLNVEVSQESSGPDHCPRTPTLAWAGNTCCFLKFLLNCIDGHFQDLQACGLSPALGEVAQQHLGQYVCMCTLWLSNYALGNLSYWNKTQASKEIKSRTSMFIDVWFVVAKNWNCLIRVYLFYGILLHNCWERWIEMGVWDFCGAGHALFFDRELVTQMYSLCEKVSDYIIMICTLFICIGYFTWYFYYLKT